MNLIFSWLIFPGFLFTFVLSLLVGWVDRKLTARIQYRVGPPWYQNFADFFKLLGKETIVPSAGNRIAFLMAPIIGFVGVLLVSVILWQINLNPSKAFIGDIIVVLYLLILPPISTIIGGSASGNPLAAIGTSREIKLLIAYELPLIFAVFTPIGKVEEINIGAILRYQSTHGMMFTNSLSSAIAFFVALICVIAKLGYVPFDLAEADTEIAEGAYIEYGGPPLAFIKLMKYTLLFVLPIFLITMFLGGINFKGLNILWTFIKYGLILFVIIVIKNVNPRVRIDQALKFFWGKVLVASIIGFILALFRI
ncbi:MAG: NADH-quinone oxidoreductase subunit H [bacterium]|nr:NADH-quinone oxidoreductase subunit H [bacterium]